MTYFKQLANNNSSLTLKRKKAYIRYNFGYFINNKLLNKDCTVLEIGPGLGEFISYCNEYGIASIDVVDTEYDILQNIKKTYHVHNTLLSSDITMVENKLSMYDIVMMTQVLEHIPKTKHIGYLQTLYRTLKKGGVIIITVPNIGNPLAIFERYYDYTHETAFTENSLLQLADFLKLEDANIKVQPFKIPLNNVINIIRSFCQQILHTIFKILYMLNGGVYPSILTTNITLIIEKTV